MQEILFVRVHVRSSLGCRLPAGICDEDFPVLYCGASMLACSTSYRYPGTRL